MSDKSEFTVRWEAADGYAGKSRPQSFTVAVEDLPAGLTAARAEALFAEMMTEDFIDKIYPESPDEEAFVEWALAASAPAENEEEA